MQSDYVVQDSRLLAETFRKKRYQAPSLIVTSPPYFNVKNYENNSRQIGFNQDYQIFLADVCNVLQQCYDIATSSASLWLVVDTVRISKRLIPLPFDIVASLASRNESTWKLKDVIVWDKSKNVPWQSKGRFRNQFEYILLFCKSEEYKFNIDRIRSINDYRKWWKSYPERYNPKGKTPTNLWNFMIPMRGWGNGYQNHLCPLPFPLIERIVSISSDKGDLVFDPFAGSGSVIAIANQMGRNAVGFDVNAAYKKRYSKEVIKGAALYWERRQMEIAVNEKKIQGFQRSNLQLRLIKATCDFQEVVSRMKLPRSLVVSMLDPGSKELHIYCLTRGVVLSPSKYQLAKMEDDLARLSGIFKVALKLHFDEIESFANRLTSEYLSAYEEKKISQPAYKVNRKEIVNLKLNGSRMILTNLYSQLQSLEDIHIPTP